MTTSTCDVTGNLVHCTDPVGTTTSQQFDALVQTTDYAFGRRNRLSLVNEVHAWATRCG